MAFKISSLFPLKTLSSTPVAILMASRVSMSSGSPATTTRLFPSMLKGSTAFFFKNFTGRPLQTYGLSGYSLGASSLVSTGSILFVSWEAFSMPLPLFAAGFHFFQPVPYTLQSIHEVAGHVIGLVEVMDHMGCYKKDKLRLFDGVLCASEQIT